MRNDTLVSDLEVKLVAVSSLALCVLILGDMYVDRARELGSYSKANHEIVESICYGFEKVGKATAP